MIYFIFSNFPSRIQGPDRKYLRLFVVGCQIILPLPSYVDFSYLLSLCCCCRCKVAPAYFSAKECKGLWLLLLFWCLFLFCLCVCGLFVLFSLTRCVTAQPFALLPLLGVHMEGVPSWRISLCPQGRPALLLARQAGSWLTDPGTVIPW